MPLYKCCSCHHEFEDYPDNTGLMLCDWCGAPSIVLEEKTPLEIMVEEYFEKEENKWKGFIEKKKKNRSK